MRRRAGIESAESSRAVGLAYLDTRLLRSAVFVKLLAHLSQNKLDACDGLGPHCRGQGIDQGFQIAEDAWPFGDSARTFYHSQAYAALLLVMS